MSDVCMPSQALQVPELNLPVTQEDVNTLKNDWLTDNVRRAKPHAQAMQLTSIPVYIVLGRVRAADDSFFLGLKLLTGEDILSASTYRNTRTLI